MTDRPLLINLQVTRFFAAVMVLCYHLIPHLHTVGIEDTRLMHAATMVGFAGVDIFFVISGFIIWHTTADESGVASASQFLRRRAARIYAGYWPLLALASLTFYWLLPSAINQKQILLSLLLIPNPANSTHSLLPALLIIPVAWTLIYEVFFYSTFSLLIALRKSTRARHALTIIAFLLATTIWSSQSLEVFSQENLLASSLVWTLYLSPYYLTFWLGCLLAALYERWHPSWPGLYVVTGVVALVSAGWINHRFFNGQLISGFHIPQRVLVFSIPSMLLVLAALGYDRKSRHFAPRTCEILGRSSYALYLSHTIILFAISQLGLSSWLTTNGWTKPGYSLLMLGIVGIAVMFYQVVERPLHQTANEVLGVNPRIG